MGYELIKVSIDGSVGIITLSRPEVLNALNLKIVNEIVEEMERMDRDDSIRVILLTGDDKAFAAGADIDEMAEETVIPMVLKDQFRVWDRMTKVTKPMIAAASGYVLGGGCELMMSCDMVVASETTLIGQPEIKLGVMPGAGGTVRLNEGSG
jgi:enoyl-CoA hydratase